MRVTTRTRRRVMQDQIDSYERRISRYRMKVGEYEGQIALLQQAVDQLKHAMAHMVAADEAVTGRPVAPIVAATTPGGSTSTPHVPREGVPTRRCQILKCQGTYEIGCREACRLRGPDGIEPSAEVLQQLYDADVDIMTDEELQLTPKEYVALRGCAAFQAESAESKETT